MIDSNVGTSALSRGELPAEMLPVSTADCGQSNGYLAPFILKFSGILAVFNCFHIYIYIRQIVHMLPYVRPFLLVTLRLKKKHVNKSYGNNISLMS